jgi:uncharacterized protein (DUF3084 family)
VVSDSPDASWFVILAAILVLGGVLLVAAARIGRGR